MRKFHSLLLFIPLCLVLTGCPVGINYPIASPGTEKIDKNLIGRWSQSNADMEVMKMEIVKLNDNTLKVTVLERGGMYMEETDEFKAWCTKIEGQEFVYLQNYLSDTSDYFHYAYKFDGKDLLTYDISLLDGGVDAVTSTEAFQTQIRTSMIKPEFLSEETRWTKE